MDIVLEIKEGAFNSSPPQPVSSSQSNNGSNMNVSPSILVIIIIIAVIFFISGLLHLLVRFLFRRNSDRSPVDLDGLTALQGQLQQLFNLHDFGVDQSFIDTLPVFNYEAITGVKDPFDCAVCLCEFEPEDKLRLLPKCSHAFHMNCIDTWLLSHSTCPICRASLVSDFPQNGHCSPVVRILESGSESYREREDGSGIGIGNAHVSSQCDDVEVGAREDEISEGKVVSIKLGKYRSVGGGDDGIGEVNEEARRCFSMGSFAYVMDEKSSLRVAISPSNKKTILPLKPGHRLAMSECGCDSTREFNGFEAFNILVKQSGGNEINKSIVTSKRESISVSKIWLRERKDEESVERRAFSFRFPVAAGESNTKNGGGRSSLSNLDQVDHQSFGRRTLQWLMGRQNKVVHSSFSTNV